MQFYAFFCEGGGGKLLRTMSCLVIKLDVDNSSCLVIKLDVDNISCLVIN